MILLLGFFVKAFIEEGTEDVPVGNVIALIAEDEEDLGKFEGYVPPASVDDEAPAPPKEEKKKAPEPVVATPKEEKKAPATTTTTAAAPKKSGRIMASPAARSLAVDLGINLASIEGSGPNGRIVLADVENFSGSAPTVETVTLSPGASSSGAAYVDIPNTNIRKVIASRLTESKQTIPHYYLTVDFCVDKLQKYVRLSRTFYHTH